MFYVLFFFEFFFALQAPLCSLPSHPILPPFHYLRLAMSSDPSSSAPPSYSPHLVASRPALLSELKDKVTQSSLARTNATQARPFDAQIHAPFHASGLGVSIDTEKSPRAHSPLRLNKRASPASVQSSITGAKRRVVALLDKDDGQDDANPSPSDTPIPRGSSSSLQSPTQQISSELKYLFVANLFDGNKFVITGPVFDEKKKSLMWCEIENSYLQKQSVSSMVWRATERGLNPTPGDEEHKKRIFPSSGPYSVITAEISTERDIE